MRADGANEVSRDSVPGLKKNVPVISSKQIGTIPFLEDNESFQDLLAFTGPAPEARTLSPAIVSNYYSHVRMSFSCTSHFVDCLSIAMQVRERS